MAVMKMSRIPKHHRVIFFHDQCCGDWAEDSGSWSMKECYNGTLHPAQDWGEARGSFSGSGFLFRCLRNITSGFGFEELGLRDGLQVRAPFGYLKYFLGSMRSGFSAGVFASVSFGSPAGFSSWLALDSFLALEDLSLGSALGSSGLASEAGVRILI